MSASTPAPSSAPAPAKAPDAKQPAQRQPSTLSAALREILGGSIVTSILAFVLALLIGCILIACTNADVQAAAGYFFSRPGDTFAAIGQTIGDTFTALFRGAIYDDRPADPMLQIKPITETLRWSTPLIAAGLGIAISFRAGMFNIGGQGQMLIGAIFAGWVSWSWPMPFFLHMLVAVVAGILGGAIWAGIVGVLRAKTGAHEVIVTIMLNYIALYLLEFMLRTPGLLQAPNTNNPISPKALPTSIMPTLSDLLGVGSFRLNFGFVLSVLAVVAAWFLMERSGLGFRIRAVGENASAARVAGIDVPRTFIYALAISGGLLGLAAADQVLGTQTSGFTSGVDSGIGFDAITVALLGRSRPWGVFLAGLLFGALHAGGFTLQASVQVPVDIVTVVQALIVLFIAAPPLIRSIFRLPTPTGVFPRLRKAAGSTPTGVSAK